RSAHWQSRLVALRAPSHGSGLLGLGPGPAGQPGALTSPGLCRPAIPQASPKLCRAGAVPGAAGQAETSPPDPVGSAGGAWTLP
ncbi:hypothetical protein MC885_006515, partial [Smutsia gigantea]